ETSNIIEETRKIQEENDLEKDIAEQDIEEADSLKNLIDLPEELDDSNKVQIDGSHDDETEDIKDIDEDDSSETEDDEMDEYSSDLYESGLSESEVHELYQDADFDSGIFIEDQNDEGGEHEDAEKHDLVDTTHTNTSENNAIAESEKSGTE